MYSFSESDSDTESIDGEQSQFDDPVREERENVKQLKAHMTVRCAMAHSL